VLPGCSTSNTSESAADAATQDKPATARGLPAKGGKTASSGYVDPALVSASSATPPSGTGIPVGAAAADYPGDAMAQGVVTQPTGIRAGSVSIFSGSAPPAIEPAANGTMPVATTTGRVDARTGSVFSAPTAPATQYDAQECGTDGDGNPLNC
jgi:hypothetical protein